ncbi:MAG: hypothetical protein UU34_C0004G0014 [Candidatus Curtissbacteria bacterium GW2011_GWA1_41_11]|uniref:Uncharacterized protein n=1 Tax=Candidatus Curtissbacteria bacterium GW2011_GWA1_41_11 TaxID=1618409 RepID=A0A0G0UEY9_9BACT|nr:MAG: hypothetical protein UU34_C0004G0014 [Candidatus Curtissbacteria bacterium GW2011_GWA1_41_11]
MKLFSDIRNIILIGLIALILFGVCYKYLEYTSLRSISDLLASTERQEIGLIEEHGKLSEKAYELFSKILTDEKTSNEEKLKLFVELEGLASQTLNNEENYIKTLESNKQKYEKLSFRTNLLVGKRGSIAKQLLDNQNRYYDNELNSAKDSYVADTMFSQLITIFKDNIALTDYDERAQKTGNDYYAENFIDIASLEKYGRSDFKFKEEDQIKKLYPYGYESLKKYKDYFGSYYAVVKDFVAGDLESAGYKYSRIQETAANLNIDFDKFIEEGDDRKKDLAKNTIETVTNKVNAINTFQEEDLGSYPALPKISKWKEDLVLCQLYAYKSQFYNLITGKYPEATNFDELLIQLSQVAPKTDDVDRKFDKSVIKFTNNDKEITFECTDKEDSKTFVFKTPK